jgi:hypothetical protein
MIESSVPYCYHLAKVISYGPAQSDHIILVRVNFSWRTSTFSE